MLKRICLLISILFFIPCISSAEIKTIYADHKYVMGDNDSKNDARHMCFLEAKRKALEMAGTYIQSHTVAKDLQLTKDEVVIYSAALLKVEIAKEEWKMAGENMAIFMTVKADVDTKTVEDQLSKITKDAGVQNKIKNQQGRLNELEQQVANLQKQLGSADAPKASSLRKERNVVFKEIDSLEEMKIEIVQRIEKRSRDVCKYITKGMSQADVRNLIGKPDGTSGYSWYYGTSSVYFHSGGLVNGVDCE